VHEMSVANEIVRSVRQALPDQEVLAVTVQVGVLAAVVPDALRFGWEVATAGTPLAGSRLVVELLPLPARCLDCGAEHLTHRPPPNPCPGCGGDLMPVGRGRELRIGTVEIEDGGPTAAGQEPSQ